LYQVYTDILSASLLSSLTHRYLHSWYVLYMILPRFFHMEDEDGIIEIDL